jgi:ketosteroid isomerase-like protein
VASLTPGALVSYLEEGMRSGSAPFLGQRVSVGEWLPLLASGIESLVAPDFVCIMVGAPGVSGTFRGLDGIYAGWRDWGEAFDELTIEFEELAEVPSGALILARQRGVSRHDRMPMEQSSALLLRLRNGRIAAAEFHLDRATAQRAANEPRRSS